MDRYECITALMAAGITWWMSVCIFHDQLARAGEARRRLLVEHYCMLAREDAQLRSEG